MLIAVNGAQPTLDPTAWVAPNAAVIGAVTMGPDSSVWYGASVRGDGDPITIGARSNLQDGVVVHTDVGRPTVIGADVSVGHKAILHGCTVGNGCLIGMGAVVMNGAVIGAGSLVAAGALVTEGTEVPPHSVVMGSPAKVVRELDDAMVAKLARNSEVYVGLKNTHASAVVL